MEVRDAARTVTSLDRPVGKEGEAALGDLLEGEAPPVDQEVEVSLSEQLLRRTIEELPETERNVIRMRYGMTATTQPLRERGAGLGCPPSGVRQIECGVKRIAMQAGARGLARSYPSATVAHVPTGPECSGRPA